MKTKLIRFFVSSFTMVFLIISAVMIMDSLFPLIQQDESNAAYALGKRRHRRRAAVTVGNGSSEGTIQDPSNESGGDGSYSVPEPSTLVLLGTGLAAGGGIYTIIKRRKRKKKS